MGGLPLLSFIILLPLLGSAFLLFIKGSEEVVRRNARWLALWISAINFILAIIIYVYFDPSKEGFQFVERYYWVNDVISFHLGIDGISMMFILLTSLLMPIAILASWETVQKRIKEYMAAFLFLEALLLGVFCALDLVLFYLFFEAVLIPMFLIIGIWGGDNRVYASFKFFFYTLLGSLLMLLAILAVYENSWTSDIVVLLDSDLPASMQYWLWLAFFASFAIKLPMWPFHTWLPDAHVEAPTAGSVILAAILLKLGGYGFVRFSLPILPVASAEFAPFVFVLSIIAIIYTSLVALVQEDIKKLIAYASIAHMGFVTMGIFTASSLGIHGGVFQMLSHGLISAGLFLSVGVLYDRLHTRNIAYFGGVVRSMPIFSVILMVFTLGNIGLPGTSGFIGEAMAIFAAFSHTIWVAAFAVIGVILSASYGLWLYDRVIFGEQHRDAIGQFSVLSIRELIMFAPLVLGVIGFGLYPKPIFNLIDPPINKIVERYNGKINAYKKSLDPNSPQTAPTKTLPKAVIPQEVPQATPPQAVPQAPNPIRRIPAPQQGSPQGGSPQTAPPQAAPPQTAPNEGIGQ